MPTLSREELILAPLVEAEEKHGELYELVYDALFAGYPDYRDLFILDSDGGLRRNMLRTTMDMIADYAHDALDEGYLYGMRLNHIHYGVDEDAFDQFFEVIAQVAAREAPDQWTPATAQAWAEMKTEFAKTRD